MSEGTPPSRTARLDPVSLVWRSLAAPQTLMVLSGLLAACLALGTLIPQIPAQAVADPEAWLAVQPGILGQTNNLISALGLFDIYHTFWFRLLLTLVGLTLSVRCTESAELAWRATGRGHWTLEALAGWGRFPLKIDFSSRLACDSVLARLQALFRSQGFSWMDVPALPAFHLVAKRRVAMLWAWPAFYAALVSGLIGLAIVDNWGWRESDWQAGLAESHAIGHGTPYAVRLEEFPPAESAGASPCARRSEIAWLEGETVVRRDSVTFGWPATFRGIAVRQVDCTPNLRLSGQDQAGRPLAFQLAGEETTTGEARVSFPTSDVQQVIYLPAQDLILALTVQTVDTDNRPAVSLAVLRNGSAERQPLATLVESGTVAVDGLQVQVNLDYRPVLRIDHRPGMALVVGALALAVVLLAAAWLVPPRLAWCAVLPAEDGSTRVQLVALPDGQGSRWLPQLAAHLQGVLADDD